MTLVTFLVSQFVPGDPITRLVSDKAPPSTIAAIRAKWGLDRPLHEQYVVFLQRLSQGDMGISIRTQRPVVQDLAQFFPATIELSLAAIIVALILGVPIGITGATHSNELRGYLVRIGSLVANSVPLFWLGLVLLMVFYSWLGLTPPGRITEGISPPRYITGTYVLDSILTGNWEALASSLQHLALPSLTLGLVVLPTITRMLRGNLLDALEQDYIVVARAKGLTERDVLYKHALKNAMIPTVTVIGILFGQLLAGAIVTETIFNWPGIGRYAVDAITSLDYPGILGVTLTVALVYTSVNFLVDMVYVLIDPRIRYD